MSVRHALLALLSDGPKYGMQLRQEFEDRTGEVWPLNVGQVYTTLQRLERDGLVESDDDGNSDGDEGPQRGFRITTEGAAELATWLRTPPDMTSPPRDELVIKVLVALQSARCRRARRGAGAPALRRGAHAAVDAPEGRRGRARDRLLVGRRRRAVPARLGDPLARRGRRPAGAARGGSARRRPGPSWRRGCGEGQGCGDERARAARTCPRCTAKAPTRCTRCEASTSRSKRVRSSR